MTLYYKALFPGRIETHSTRSRGLAVCLIVSWPTATAGIGGYVTWCATHAGAAGKVIRERGQGRSVEIAEAAEIDAKEYRILKASARANGRP